jgi:hypothetical protein
LNNLQIFKSEEFREIRTVTIDGKPAYVAPLLGKVKTADVPKRLATADARWKQVESSTALKSYFRDWYIVGPFDNSDYAGENFQLKDFGPEKGLDLNAAYQGMQAGDKGFEPTTVRWQPFLKDGEPALSDKPMTLLGRFAPDKGVIAYACTTIISDRKRTVQLLTGSDERLGVWVNGQRVVFNRGYRMAYKDQDRNMIILQKGENSVMVKMGHGYEAWRMYFRLADEYGMPITEGVSYKGAHGVTPAG